MQACRFLATIFFLSFIVGCGMPQEMRPEEPSIVVRIGSEESLCGAIIEDRALYFVQPVMESPEGTTKELVAWLQGKGCSIPDWLQSKERANAGL